jgi:hypothetical protein
MSDIRQSDKWCVKRLLFLVLGFCIAAALLLTSCAVKQKATLEVDGSGSVSFRFELEQFFLDALVDMASLEEGSDTAKEGTVFDVDKIRAEFAKKPDVQLVNIESPNPRVLEGTFVFKSVEEVFRSEVALSAAGVISFMRQGVRNTIRVHLDRENFQEVSAFLALKENPLFEMFGPEENEGTTEEEYLEMVEFMLGEKGPQSLTASTVELQVVVKGRILSQTGGQVVDGSVVFRTPLIRVLLLDRPLDYSIVFQ